MCGRFLGLTYDEVVRVVAAVNTGTTRNVLPDWPACTIEARPGSTAWVITRSSSDTAYGGAQGLGAGLGAAGVSCVPAEARWGFSVEWSSSPVFNTRIEKAAGPTPGFWEAPIRQGRCLVPAYCFFEPHATETERNPKTGRTVKRQYAFRHPDGDVLLMAAVIEDGSFSIVTTQPNEAVAGVHDRMPLVVRPAEVGMWFSPHYADLSDRSDVQLAGRPEHEAAADQLSLF